MAKFSEYLSEIKQQTDELRLVVTEKSGTDCSGLSISEVSAVVENLSTGGRDPILQEKSVDPSTVTQDVVPDSGFDGLSKVQVNAVTSAIDSNILAGNIKKDVTILGVTGTLEQGGAEDLTEELTAQDTALTSLESAVDKLPEPKPDRLQLKCDNVKKMNYEFQYYTGQSLDDILVGLDTSNVTHMSYMFNNCTNITTIPEIDTSSCIDMSNMFKGCTKLTTIPQLDTTKTTNMSSMFSGCSAIEKIPQLDTRNATTVRDMFNACSNITTIPLLDVIKVSSSNLTNLVLSCYKLTNLTLKNIKYSLRIGGGTGINMYGHLLTDESLINTAKELWDMTGGTSQTLTVSTTSDERFDAIYVKLIEATADMIANDEYITNKKPCTVCESTDEGAMTLREYVVSKNWVLAK